jgi:DNA polymerase-3 subunit epsilon
MTEAKYLVFDTETTGVDTDNDRIVQLVIATADRDGNLLAHREWLIDPEVPIPEEASAVHGLTNAYLEENGGEPFEALLAAWEFSQTYANIPQVAYNLNFDASILQAEMERHGVDSNFGDDLESRRLFDPLVVDRAKDRYRKGKRKLFNVAEHYGVDYDEEKLHNALYDVEITAKVAAKVAAKYGIPSNEEQAEMHRAWAENFEKYLRKANGDDTIEIEKDWPLRKKEEQ